MLRGTGSGSIAPVTEAGLRVLGTNAIYHVPAAALVVAGEVVPAAEEERFSRRKHGKRAVARSARCTPDSRAGVDVHPMR